MPRIDANLTHPAPLILNVLIIYNLFDDVITKLTTSASHPIFIGKIQTAKIKVSIEQVKANFGKPVEMSIKMFVPIQYIRTTKILMFPNPLHLHVPKQA